MTADKPGGPQDAQKEQKRQEAKWLAGMQTPRERRARKARGWTYLVLAVLSIPLALTGSRALVQIHGAERLDWGDRGTAIVRECEQGGPVSFRGFGYWWDCTAEVRWDDGDRSVEEFLNSELTPGDKGKAVPVVYQFEEGRSSSSRHHATADIESFLRDVNRPFEWLGTTLGIAGFLAAFGFAGNALLKLVPFAWRLESDNGLRKKIREQYQREYRRPRM